MLATYPALWTIATWLLAALAGFVLLFTFIIAVVALFATRLLLLRLPRRRPLEKVKEALNDYRSRHRERIYLDGLSCEQLMALYKEHPSAEAEKKASAYLGKWMRISGAVRSVNIEEGRGAIVYLDEPHSPSLRFTARSLAQLEFVRPGDRIDAQGQVRAIAHYWMELNNCELL